MEFLVKIIIGFFFSFFKKDPQEALGESSEKNKILTEDQNAAERILKSQRELTSSDVDRLLTDPRDRNSRQGKSLQGLPPAIPEE